MQPNAHLKAKSQSVFSPLETTCLSVLFVDLLKLLLTLRSSHTSSFLQNLQLMLLYPPFQGRTTSGPWVTLSRFSMDALGFITQCVFHPSFQSESKPPTNLPQPPRWPDEVSAGYVNLLCPLGERDRTSGSPEAVSQNMVTSQDIKWVFRYFAHKNFMPDTTSLFKWPTWETAIRNIEAETTEEAESWHCWAWSQRR